MRTENLENITSDVQEFVVNANLELIIEGLVLIYEKNGILMMRFPQSDDHLFRLDITRNGLPYLGFNVPVGSQIDVTHDGATSVMNNNFRDVLNVKSFHPRLKLKPDDSLKKLSYSLSMANAQVKPFVDSGIPKTKFECWEVTEDHGVPVKRRKFDLEPQNGIVAVMIGGVAVPFGHSTNIKISGDVPFETRLEYTNNIKYRMKISNHCEKPDCEFRSDFYHYYELFDEDSLDEKKIELTSPTTRGYRAPCNIVYVDSNPE